MKKIEKILAPPDLSELSGLGLRYAIELSRGWSAEVTVYDIADGAELASYKAFSLQDLIEKHKKSLSEFLQQHFGDLLPFVEAREKVEVGKPAASIFAEAEKAGSDLIVMSTHGKTGLAHLLVDSVTEEIARNAVCPVFSVHAPKT